MTATRIASLRVYPVKSCRGIELEQSTVLLEGLRHDREWMVVDANGRFLTQREVPALARVGTGLDKHFLTLSALGHGAVRLPLRYADGPVVPVQCWRFEAQALDCGLEAAQWLTDLLGLECRLVRFSRHDSRACNPEWTGGHDARTWFSDGYPILVLGSASVADLRERMGVSASDLPIDRFRPNLVIDGLPAYEEDQIDLLQAGELTLKLVKPCPRCSIPDLDQVTGLVSGPSPLATLNRYRQHARAGGAVLGMNAIVLSGAGHIMSKNQVLGSSLRFTD